MLCSWENNCRPVKSNGSLPPGGWLIVTCGLTACSPGSALGPTLGNEYGKPLLLRIYLSFSDPGITQYLNTDGLVIGRQPARKCCSACTPEILFLRQVQQESWRRTGWVCYMRKTSVRTETVEENGVENLSARQWLTATGVQAWRSSPLHPECIAHCRENPAQKRTATDQQLCFNSVLIHGRFGTIDKDSGPPATQGLHGLCS